MLPQACLDLKVQSQNDTKKLAEAKQQVYLKGFTDGVLLAGPHKGEKVRQASAPSVHHCCLTNRKLQRHASKRARTCRSYVC